MPRKLGMAVWKFLWQLRHNTAVLALTPIHWDTAIRLLAPGQYVDDQPGDQRKDERPER